MLRHQIKDVTSGLQALSGANENIPSKGTIRTPHAENLGKLYTVL